MASRMDGQTFNDSSPEPHSYLVLATSTCACALCSASLLVRHFVIISSPTMKVVLSVLTLAAAASAFAPSASLPRGLTSSVATATPTQLFSEPEDDDEEGLDLNLEEMFDMYVATLPSSCAQLKCCFARKR